MDRIVSVVTGDIGNTSRVSVGESRGFPPARGDGELVPAARYLRHAIARQLEGTLCVLRCLRRPIGIRCCFVCVCLRRFGIFGDSGESFCDLCALPFDRSRARRGGLERRRGTFGLLARNVQGALRRSDGCFPFGD